MEAAYATVSRISAENGPQDVSRQLKRSKSMARRSEMLIKRIFNDSTVETEKNEINPTYGTPPNCNINCRTWLITILLEIH